LRLLTHLLEPTILPGPPKRTVTILRPSKIRQRLYHRWQRSTRATAYPAEMTLNRNCISSVQSAEAASASRCHEQHPNEAREKMSEVLRPNLSVKVHA